MDERPPDAARNLLERSETNRGQDMVLPRNKRIVPLSRALRTNATPQENHLWYDYLRTYPVQFNRQRIIGRYIVDFYCAIAKLAIEIDGGQHFEKEAQEYDRIRTEYLESAEIEVLRFTNTEVEKQFEGVCQRIDQQVKARTSIST